MKRGELSNNALSIGPNLFGLSWISSACAIARTLSWVFCATSMSLLQGMTMESLLLCVIQLPFSITSNISTCKKRIARFQPKSSQGRIMNTCGIDYKISNHYLCKTDISDNLLKFIVKSRLQLLECNSLKVTIISLGISMLMWTNAITPKSATISL